MNYKKTLTYYYFPKEFDPEKDEDIKQVAKLFKTILEEIVKMTDTKLPVTITARNINFEFYWEQKCLEDPAMKNVKKEQHGNSFK